MTLNDWCAIVKGFNDAHDPQPEVMSVERFEELKKRYPDKKK